MTDPETDYERWRRAERELGAHGDAEIKPIEETDEVAEAVEDDTPVTRLEELAKRQAEQPPRTSAEQPKPDDETGPTRHTTPDELAGHGHGDDEGDRPA